MAIECGVKMRAYVSIALTIALWLWGSSAAAADTTAAERQAAYAKIVSDVATDGFTGLTAAATPSNHYNRDANKALLVYGNDGKPLSLPLPQVDEDDTIWIAVISLDGNSVDEVRPTTCTAGPAVRVYAPAGPMAPNAALVVTAAPHMWTKVQACSSDQGLKVETRSNNTPHDITVPTLPLYRLTVGISMIYDHARTTSFSAQTVKGNSVPSIVEDSHVTGLAAVAFVSLRLLTVDQSRPRCSDTNFAHCLGRAVSPVIGVNVTAPIDHLYLGLNVEPWPGLGLVFGYHFQRTDQLANGYNVGDLLPTGSVPTVKRWEDAGAHFNGFIGFNLDAGILAKLVAGFGK